ncbi:helix-turn-helix domain-containing protein [Corynebacterium variabile]|uniref:helix-turn-helix domain-containing protein n=1 Tax=Corynebacterium variabile TaxID=1727 RepID=UPI003F90A345
MVSIGNNYPLWKVPMTSPLEDHELLPLSWLYSQSHLQLRSIVASPTRTGFSAVHPIELEDPAEFLAPDAVVVTVGIPLRDYSSDRFDEAVHTYVARIAASGATGIGFGTGLFFRHVPTALVDAVREHQMALFEIPRPVPFMSILSAVQEERARRARLAQEQLIAVQQQLTAAAVSGGMEALLATTANRIDAALAVTDNDGRPHAGHSHAGIDAVWVARLQRTSSAAEDPDTGTWRITQLMEKQGERHHLLTAVGYHPFTPHQRSVLRHCSGLADLILQRPSYLRSAHREINGLAMSLLLGIQNPGSGSGVPQTFAHAVDAHGQIRPVVIQADRPGDLASALDRTDRRAESRGRQSYALSIGPDTTLLFVRGTRTVEEIVDDIGSARRSLRIAVGEPIDWDRISLERVRRLETSARALPQGEAAGPFVAGANWLSDRSVRTALDRRAAETVDRLAAEDENLVATLSTWLRTGSKALTSETLGIHRHTVRARLERIGEICEVDLEDPVTRAELLLVMVTRTRAGE